jgi:hypothetical protein
LEEGCSPAGADVISGDGSAGNSSIGSNGGPTPPSQGIEDYNALAKFRRREVSYLTIVTFVVILVVVGALGSTVANLIFAINFQ